MEYVTSVPKKVDNFEYEQIKKKKEPRGIFTCHMGKLYSVLDNMKGLADEENFYSEDATYKHLVELSKRYRSK